MAIIFFDIIILLLTRSITVHRAGSQLKNCFLFILNVFILFICFSLSILKMAQIEPKSIQKVCINRKYIDFERERAFLCWLAGLRTCFKMHCSLVFFQLKVS